jgi:NAD(P)-dependent dehydrogenase (short-subunit alcohol dehydrogenase family)
MTGKTILITGASKGIGRAAASSYAKAGASNIIIGARSPLDDTKREVLSAAKEAGRPVPEVLTLELDVSDQASVEAAARRVEQQHKSLDVLVNNAGYLEPWDSVAESDPARWWMSWQVNVLGTYLMCRSFLPLLLASELKTVLNVVSSGAHRLSPGASAYQTAKLAVCRFSEFLMVENGEKGLIAISVHPGGVPTELAKGMPEYMMHVLRDTAELGADTFVALTEQRRQWLGGRYLRVNWDLAELDKKRDYIVREDLLKVRLDVGGI